MKAGFMKTKMVSLKFRPGIKTRLFLGGGTWPGGGRLTAGNESISHLRIPAKSWTQKCLKKWRDISVLQEGRKHGDDVDVLVDSFWWLLSGKKWGQNQVSFFWKRFDRCSCFLSKEMLWCVLRAQWWCISPQKKLNYFLMGNVHFWKNGLLRHLPLKFGKGILVCTSLPSTFSLLVFGHISL